MIEIARVTTRREFKNFLTLPRRIYKQMPGYSPPLDLERRMLLDRSKSAFFNHGDAQYWLALRNGETIGRISAQVSTIPQPDLQNMGYFGCLDSTDDGEAVTALLDTAGQWLRQQGKSHARGPFNLTINSESGLLVEGHLEPSMMLTPWSPPYLEGHVLAAQFLPAKDLLTYSLEASSFKNLNQLNRISGRLKAAGVTTRNLDLKNWKKDADIVCELFNDAWRDNWGFIPFQVDEIHAMFRELRPFLNKESGVIVEAHSKPVAFSIGIQNLNELSGDFDGRLLPVNWLKFLWRMKFHNYETGRLLLMGTSSDIRHSVLGSLIPMLMIDQFVTTAEQIGLQSVELGWILENNGPTRAMAERQGATICRRHRVYEKAL